MHQPKAILVATMLIGSVGISASTVLAQANPVGTRYFLQIQNTHTAQTLWYTIDGVTSAASGTGFSLGPGQSATYELVVPNNAVSLAGSGAGTTYAIAYI